MPALRSATCEGPVGPLHFLISGEQESSDAPVVVLIHGLNASSQVWVEVAERLDDYRIIIPDLRGHGQSTMIGPYFTDSYAADVQTICEHEGIARVVAVGSSFGGAVALRLACDSTLELPSFGLLGTALKGSAKALVMALQFLDELGVDMFFQHIAEHFSLAPGALAQQIELVAKTATGRPLPVVRAVLEAGFIEDLRPLADRAPAPALVAVGAQDATCPRPVARALAKRLGAPLEVIPDAGHLPMLEQPDAVAAFVRSVVTLAT